jgi:hypothetical protein
MALAAVVTLRWEYPIPSPSNGKITTEGGSELVIGERRVDEKSEAWAKDNSMEDGDCDKNQRQSIHHTKEHSKIRHCC